MWEAAKPVVHSIAIELTPFCNQHCDYCYNAFREDGGAGVGTPELAAIVAKLDAILATVDLDHVTITGGEPLASHDLFPFLDALRARRVKAQMISNGGLVTDAVAMKLARHRLTSVLVTLNGPDAATHDPIVGGKREPTGHFDKTIEGIRLLKKHRVPVEGSIVVTRLNVDLVGATLARFVELGVRRIALSRVSPAGYALKFLQALLPSPEEVTRALEQAEAFAARENVALFATMPLPPCVVDRDRFPSIDFHDCPIGTPGQEFALGPRGELRLCPLHRDALSDDLREAFTGAHLRSYRADVPAHCRGCAHEASCGGGCGAASVWLDGDRARPDPFVALAKESRRALPVIA